jgi:hypothetical protein
LLLLLLLLLHTMTPRHMLLTLHVSLWLRCSSTANGGLIPTQVPTRPRLLLLLLVVLAGGIQGPPIQPIAAWQLHMLLCWLHCSSIRVVVPQCCWHHGVVLPCLHTRQAPCSSSTQGRQRAPQHIEVASTSRSSSSLALVTATAMDPGQLLLWLLLAAACWLLVGGR